MVRMDKEWLLGVMSSEVDSIHLQSFATTTLLLLPSGRRDTEKQSRS